MRKGGPIDKMKRVVSFVAVFLIIFPFIFPFLGCSRNDEKVRYSKRSEFQRVLVIDRGDKRYLRFGTTATGNQSTISLSNPDSVPVEYIRSSLLGMVMIPKRERVLMIGLGGGTFTTLLRRHFPDLWIDVVEIDPVVVEAAKRFFGVQEDQRFRIYVQDGAKFVRQTPHLYDLVLLDAYSGEGLPSDLVSPAFFAAVKNSVSDEGVVILNLWDQGRSERFLAARFQAAFPQTACIRSTDSYNLLLYGKKASMPIPTELREAARRFTSEAGLSFDLAKVAEKLATECP